MSDHQTYAHTTSLAMLKRMLSESGQIKSLRHITKDTPDALIKVEPLPIPIHKRLSARLAYDIMKYTKEPDKIFLTRNGYLPNYGDVVITKRLGNSVREHDSWNTIPEEFTTRRRLSLRNNAKIYVPDEEYEQVVSEFGNRRIYPKSKLELPAYGISDRAKAWWAKIRGKFTKEGSDAAYKRLFGTPAQLVGSEALGINVPGSSDTDVFVPYKRRGNFERALWRMECKYPDLHLNSASLRREDKKTFTGNVKGNPMDVVVAYGPRAEKFRTAFNNARTMLSDKRRAEIIAEKQRIKNSWFFPELRYKWYKKQLATELGLKDAYF